MAEDFLSYIPGIPIDKEDDDNDMHMFDSVLESRQKYMKTLELLKNIHNPDNSVTSVDINKDEHINFIVKTTQAVKVRRNTIQPVHPGIEIFSKGQMKCLFRIDSLSLDKFSIGALAQNLYGYNSSELLSMLRFCVDVQAANDPGLSRFMFFVMSIHEERRIGEACLNILSHYSNSFKPALNDIFAVFVNWGFAVDILYPESYNAEFQLPEFLDHTEFQLLDSLNDTSFEGNVNFSDLQHNIENVLSYLMSWKSDKIEMMLLIRMLLLSSLDKGCRLVSCKFYECICALVSRNNWSVEYVGPLVELLHFKKLHFHNQAKASDYMRGRSEFAHQVSTSLAYATLQQLLSHKKIQYVQKVNVHYLSRLNLDIARKKSYYEIHTIVRLLKYCMKELHSEAGFNAYLKLTYSWLTTLQESLQRGTRTCDEHILNEFVSRILNSWSCEYRHLCAGDLPQKRLL